jgi:outer membrane receptor protein involved in Fe transport
LEKQILKVENHKKDQGEQMKIWAFKLLSYFRVLQICKTFFISKLLKNLYLGILFLFTISTYQTVNAQTTGSISGKVIDNVNQETVPFVSIIYYQDLDSLNFKALQTDVNGVFSIKNIPFGSYTLKFSFIGYQTQKITKILLEQTRADVNLQNVALLNDSKMLNEVVIEYKKPLVEVQEDKIVYNVDQSIFSEGSVATDILKNVPLVTVDIDGKASIAGKKNTRIFIDGKPSDYSASSIGDLLSILPSDALESVEVITDPSSKFDADGDGIINIVMKKGKKLGLTGNLSTRVGTLGNYNTGVFLSQKNTKFSFSANAGFNHNVRFNDANSNKINLFTDTTFNDQSNNSDRIYDGFNTRLGGNYQIDSAQSLKFSFRGGFNGGDNNSLSNNFFLNSNQAVQTLRRQSNLSANSSFDFVADFDYTLRTKAKSTYTFGLNFQKNSSSSNRDFTKFTLNADGSQRTNPNLQLNDNEDLGNNLELNLDYDKNFNFLKSRLELGVKGAFNASDESQAVQVYNYLTNQYEFNNSLTNQFQFNQNIYSAYASYRFKIQKWSIRMGNRVELTNVVFQQENAAKLNIDPYINLFPSLAVNRTFNNKYSFGLNYSKRVARPRQNALNPIIDNSDPDNLRFGNPDLVPSFTNQFEANFSVFSENWSFSPRISYAKANKIIERFKTANPDGTSVTTYNNVGNSSSLNFNVFGNYRPSKNQTFNAGFTLSQISYTSVVNSALSRNGIGIRSNIGINYSFKKATAVEANLNYNKNVAAQGTSQGSIETQFGIRQNMFKNKIGARLTAVDPFTQRNNTSITEGPNFYQESFSVQRTRNFLLSLSYRFTKINKGTNKTGSKAKT